MKGRKGKIWLKALCCVLLAMAAIAGCYKLRHYVIAVKAKQERMAKFDSAEKVEQVIGMAFPDFHVVDYSERRLRPDEYYLPRYICKAKAEFDMLPTAVFYNKLDSLSQIDGSHWKKGTNSFFYDSIAGQVTLSEMVLSLIMMSGNKDLYIEYDVLELD